MTAERHYLERRLVMARLTEALSAASLPGTETGAVLATLYKRLDELPVVTLAEPPAGGSVTREMGPVG